MVNYDVIALSEISMEFIEEDCLLELDISIWNLNNNQKPDQKPVNRLLTRTEMNLGDKACRRSRN